MNDSERLARQLEMALNGGAWHGPSWKEVLEGVTAKAAATRPVEDAHAIVEIVGHAAAWNEIVRLRIEGGAPNITNEQNWPEAGKLVKKTWEAATARLFDEGAALCRTVAAFPPKRLQEARPAPASGTWEDLILGQLQHLTYHAGQVAVLRKGG